MLIVDDDAAMRGLLGDFLEESGYETVRASSGAEALSRVAEANLSAGILDIGLPGMDGLELARRIRLASPDLPIMILTGGHRDAAIHGIPLGIFDFSRRPLDSRCGAGRCAARWSGSRC